MLKLTEDDYRTLYLVFDLAKDSLENIYGYMGSKEDIEFVIKKIEKLRKIIIKNTDTF